MSLVLVGKTFEFVVLVLDYSAFQIVGYSYVQRTPRAADHHVHVIVVLTHTERKVLRFAAAADAAAARSA